VYYLAITNDAIASICNDNISPRSAEPNRVIPAVSHENQVIARSGENNIGARRVVKWAGKSKPARTERASTSLAIPSVDPIVAAPTNQQISSVPANKYVVSESADQPVSTPIAMKSVVPSATVEVVAGGRS
jgi:hypothetical protein